MSGRSLRRPPRRPPASCRALRRRRRHPVRSTLVALGLERLGQEPRFSRSPHRRGEDAHPAALQEPARAIRAVLELASAGQVSARLVTRAGTARKLFAAVRRRGAARGEDEPSAAALTVADRSSSRPSCWSASPAQRRDRTSTRGLSTGRRCDPPHGSARHGPRPARRLDVGGRPVVRLSADGSVVNIGRSRDASSRRRGPPPPSRTASHRRFAFREIVAARSPTSAARACALGRPTSLSSVRGLRALGRGIPSTPGTTTSLEDEAR